MNNFQNDSSVLAAQNTAYQAKAFETQMMNAFFEGRVSEQEYCSAMDATEMACKAAIAAGATHKDLPAH